MTDTHQRHDVEDFYRSAHPIRRFVTGLVAVALVLGGTWWAGLLAPRLSAQLVSGRHDPFTGRGVVELAVSNEAPTAVDVRDLALDLGPASVTSVTLDGRPLAAHHELAGGSTSVLVLQYDADRCPVAERAPTTFVSVEVETPLGLVRREPVAIAPPSAGDVNGTSAC